MIRRNGRTGYQEFNAYQTTAYLMQRQASRLGLSTHRRMTVKEVFDIEATIKMFKDERSKGGNAAGIDGVRRNEIHVFEFCSVARPIVKSIQDGTFVPEDLRRVDIPKPNGKVRTLNLNPLIERVVYKSAAQRLGQALASGFPSYMHGGLSERGPHTFFVGLQLAADKLADAPELWLVERDIVSAFDNVALSAVQDSLVEMNLSQDLAETLIRVTNPEANRRRLEELRGVPQGNPLSSLLFNATIFQCMRRSNSDVAEENRLSSFLAYVDNLAYVAPERRIIMQVISNHENSLSKIGLNLNQNEPVNLREGRTANILKEDVGLEEGGRNLFFKISDKRFASLKQELMDNNLSATPYEDQLSKARGFAGAKGHVWSTCGRDYCTDIVDKLCADTELKSDNARQKILNAWEKAGQVFSQLLISARSTLHRPQ